MNDVDRITSHVRSMKWEALRSTIQEVGGRYRETPVRLGTGELLTHVYLDVKGVLINGTRLNLAADVLLDWIASAGLADKVTAIGGPTMGADVLSHVAVARNNLARDVTWFSIRDHAKTDHGMGKLIEGAELTPGDKVIITDDVANSGKSLVEAVAEVRKTGAEVLAVMPLVDRSDKTAAKMMELGVFYLPVMLSEDLGLAALT